MTWLLRLSYAALLTASVKLPILLLAKACSPTPHCHFTSNQITTWTNCAEKNQKEKQQQKKNDLMIFTWIALIALLNSHSQFCAGKNIMGSPEQQLNESSRLLRGRVKCHHKSSTKVTCEHFHVLTSMYCLWPLSTTEPLFSKLTQGCLSAIIHALLSSGKLSYHNYTK